MQIKKLTFLLFILIIILTGLYAQTEFPAGDFWALDAGIGMSDILVKGVPFQAIIDPKLWLSPPLMVGSKVGVNFSSEEDSSVSNSNIITFEGQVYLRWNFLRLGSNPNKTVNIFAQAGVGLISAYRGTDANPFGDVTMTRGSLLADAALGVTIPLTERWHIEPSVRGGYPHILGVSLTAGYKFKLPEKTRYINNLALVSSPAIEYVEVVRMLPPEEIIKRIMISSIEFILFGPDIGEYNVGIDHDAQGLNELVLNSTAQMLKDNPDYRVRIEGHANPYTVTHSEAAELQALSATRAEVVAEQLRARGVSDDQMVVISFGGTRNVTSDHDIVNRNRRVELIILNVDAN